MRTSRVVLTFLLGLAAMAGLPGCATAAELDPIVAQVIQILETGVSDELIVQWLEGTGRRPRDLGSQDLIALTEAGASEELISRLLQRVGEASVAEATEPPEPPPAAAEAGAALTEPARGATPGGDRRAETRIRLSARQIWVQEDEPDSPRADPYGVFLYLDGRYAARVKPSLRGEPVELRRLLVPGRHELRLLLETHVERKGRWSHDSLVVSTAIAFAVEPGDPLEIDIHLSRGWELGRPGAGGPLSYVVRQGDRLVAEQERAGGSPSEWPPVCEDVEANFPGEDRVPRRYRSEMRRCVRWTTLWRGQGQGSSRQELLAWMGESDFRPPRSE